VQQHTLRRKPIVPPALADLDGDLVDRLFRSSAALCCLMRLGGEIPMRASDNAFASLVHPLSPSYVELNGPAATPPRASDEAAALAWFEIEVALIDPDHPDAFAAVLEMLDRRLVGDAGGWRPGPIGTAADPRGNKILFPPVAEVAGQLVPLRALLASDPLTTPAVFAASMALALLTNCHPFRDGNGRVARILFNHALRRGGMPPHVYVPFSELAGRSDGGYLIALRQGELHGRWAPYLEFVLTMLDVHRNLATGACDARHGR
jgi:hypothetical protein